jgi:hypothetical protein
MISPGNLIDQINPTLAGGQVFEAEDAFGLGNGPRRDT